MSPQIKKIREEMYDLVGHISSGQYSDLDAYWSSLADSIASLKFKDGFHLKAASNTDSPKGETRTSTLLQAIDDNYDVEIADLVSVCIQMEDISEGGSEDTIEEEEADELQTFAEEFELEFEVFLKDILPELVLK